MKQRVAFASALLHEPEILVLDEPMVGLDPRTMRLVKDLLKNEAQNGLTVFMSTHTLSVAEEVATRIGVIDQGKLLFLGTVEELRQYLSAAESNLEDLFLRLTDSDDDGESEPVPEEAVS
jgi:ABC-2 type transport system ATP-binding protein